MKPNVSSRLFWGAVVILLLGIVGLIFKNQKVLSQNQAVPLLNFPMQHVQSFTIEDFTHGLRFTQDVDGTWQVAPQLTDLQKKISDQNQPFTNQQTHAANREMIVAYLTQLSLIKVQAPVATNTKPEAFQINPMSLHIRFYGGANTVLGTIFIGKKGFEQMSTYVMRSDDNDVYWIAEDIRTQALLPLEYWLNKND